LRTSKKGRMMAMKINAEFLEAMAKIESKVLDWNANMVEIEVETAEGSRKDWITYEEFNTRLEEKVEAPGDPPRVYVIAPYGGKGEEVAENIRLAIEAAEEIVKGGGIPFVPHLYHLWHLITPHDKEFWMRQDRQWIWSCDYAVRVGGESEGCTKDEELCEALGIEVFKGDVRSVAERCRIWVEKDGW